MPSPLAVAEGVIEGEVTLPEPGLYYFELWANGEMLMSRRLTAMPIPNEKPQT
jgi:hypothetical protein